MPVLSLKNVSYSYITPYGSVEAVRHVDYAFEKGRMYALTGTSGSGKTTLLSLMAGLDLPTEGEVAFCGKATAALDLDRYRRENVAVIYQSFNLLSLLTVAENVMYPMELVGTPAAQARQRARELIGQVGLNESEFGRFPTMLSGGQQQRVAIARALGTTAEVILADEPTGNLDAENSGNVIDLLAGLAHTRDYCVIVVTHDMEIAQKADVIIRLADGEIVG